MPQHSPDSQRSAVTEDERLLTAVAPTERRAFVHTDPWRVLRIMGEFVEGFDTLSDVRYAVTVFGSARTKPDDPYYEKAVETARLLAKHGFPIITGGGPGIMEAANRGAQEGNGLSIGCNIELPFEQGTNPYVERSTHWFVPCSNGSSMLQPIESPPPSLAPRLAAAMIPGPPPVMIAKPSLASIREVSWAAV